MSADPGKSLFHCLADPRRWGNERHGRGRGCRLPDVNSRRLGPTLRARRPQEGWQRCHDLPACMWTVAAGRTMCLNLPPAAKAGDWMKSKEKAEVTLMGS